MVLCGCSVLCVDGVCGEGRQRLWGCVLGVEGSVISCWWEKGFSLEKGHFFCGS